MKPLYKAYEDAQPIGYYLMGFCGYAFFEPIGDDRNTCDYVTCYEYPTANDPRGYVRESFRRSHVTYGERGDRSPHVWRQHMRIYLRDVIAFNK